MNTLKKIIIPGAVAVSGFVGVGGASLLTSISAHAATVPAATSTTSSSASATEDKTDQSKGGHTANGITEALLTGDNAAKAKAAAEAAVSGGTVLRVENDAEGATYEAHVQKTDGSEVTVKMDASFKVTSTEAGRGGPGSNSSDSN